MNLVESVQRHERGNVGARDHRVPCDPTVLTESMVRQNRSGHMSKTNGHQGQDEWNLCLYLSINKYTPLVAANSPRLQSSPSPGFLFPESRVSDFREAALSDDPEVPEGLPAELAERCGTPVVSLCFAPRIVVAVGKLRRSRSYLSET